MKLTKEAVFAYAAIAVGAAAYGVATTLFLFPHGLLLGGTSGISVILTHFLPFSPGSILQVINYGLLLIAFPILGRKMGVRNFVGSALTALSIKLFESLFNDLFSTPAVPNIYLSSVCGAVLIALASGVMFYVGSSSGGTDIIAQIVNKYSSLNVGKALLLTDVLIVVVGGVISGVWLMIASFTGLLIKTLGIDFVIGQIKKRNFSGEAPVKSK